LRERLHALWLVASGAQSSRTALARALGRKRETISRWLGDYAHGGLAALLRARKPTGPPSQGAISLPAEVRA
jgi:transposase-like protein